MGNEVSGSTGNYNEERIDDPVDFVNKLDAACNGDGSIEVYKKLWASYAEMFPKGGTHEATIISDSRTMKCLKFGFRHKKTEWREAGIDATEKLLHNAAVRQKLIKLDFIGYVLLISLPDFEVAENEDLDRRSDQDAKKDEARQITLQILAANVINSMADYEEFKEQLCETSVLNFLCIVLNQVQEAVKIVTAVFEKLAEKPERLVFLTEGAVADILEAFFKRVAFEKPSDSEHQALLEWERNMPAMAHAAHTLGTLIEYKNQCAVDLPKIINVCRYFLSLKKRKGAPPTPDNIRLIMEMSRLFYWHCRHSKDLHKVLVEASYCEEVSEPDQKVSIQRSLETLYEVWKRCVTIHEFLNKGFSTLTFNKDLEDFCTDDLDKTKKLAHDSEEMKKKIADARSCLCYSNCTMWILLPTATIRWKLRMMKVEKLYYAFELRDTELLTVVIGTVRHILDLPEAQSCHDFIRFFGEQLIILIDAVVKGEIIDIEVVMLLLDATSILAMQREMQEVLADFDIEDKLRRLSNCVKRLSADAKQVAMVDLAVLRILAEVAMHPSHRLPWISKMSGRSVESYPPRRVFEHTLMENMKKMDANVSTISSLLLTAFREDKFKQNREDIVTTFNSVNKWWEANTTARYEDEKDSILEAEQGQRNNIVEGKTVDLKDILRRAQARAREDAMLTSMETMPYCAPHECVLALSLFSRLALEPKFKKLFLDRDSTSTLISLLACVGIGIWAEAREAAATLANLMWMPDQEEERLVCWLKFDGAKCIALDASNVLLPVKAGNPLPVAIGKGMYKSCWGIEFVENSCVTLHPDGLKTHKVPGTLTSASPSITFQNTSRKPYQWLLKNGDEPQPKHFTISCWYYQPVSESAKADKVLVQGGPPDYLPQIYIDFESNESKEAQRGFWRLTDAKKTIIRLQTPRLNPGWHLVSLVSSSDQSDVNRFNGTKFFLDDWQCFVPDKWVNNDFYIVGNDVKGRRPIGLITDFRIYARPLLDEEIQKMAQATNTDDHPDHIARQLLKLNAASILAQRLDVPDSAAECLRALGSLATVDRVRAKIFGVCGRQALRLLDSPLPMVNRMAARLMNNLA